jgi:hypothetical protein
LEECIFQMSLLAIWNNYEQNGSTQILKNLILDLKTDVNTLFTVDDVIQDTLLTRMSAYGDDDMVEFLLKECGANPNVASCLVSRTAKHLTIPDIVKIVDIFDMFGISLPIHFRLKSIGYIDKKDVQYMLNIMKGCYSSRKMSESTLDVMDSLCDLMFNFIYGYNTTPIESAIIRNRYYEKPSTKTIQLLIKYGGLYNPWVVDYI